MAHLLAPTTALLVIKFFQHVKPKHNSNLYGHLSHLYMCILFFFHLLFTSKVHWAVFSKLSVMEILVVFFTLYMYLVLIYMSSGCPLPAACVLTFFIGPSSSAAFLEVGWQAKFLSCLAILLVLALCCCCESVLCDWVLAYKELYGAPPSTMHNHLLKNILTSLL